MVFQQSLVTAAYMQRDGREVVARPGVADEQREY
jgi:predicted Rossmann fold nucleotide-binding protein DprA/Smf involved in DNA uptake